MNKQLKENITKRYGDLGVRWLKQIPEITALCARRWHLVELKEMPEASVNYLMSGYQNNRAIILKLSPEPWTLAAEARALKALAGYSAIALLGEGEDALLLERAQPGGSLQGYFLERESDAITIFCQVMRELHRAPRPQGGFVHISDWLGELENNWAIPRSILDKARKLKDQLLDSSGPDILLHGDLHHGNILENTKCWVAIDPKGVLGEGLYEAGAFIRNPIHLLSATPRLMAQDTMRNRIEKTANFFGSSPKRLTQWCFVQAVLAWIWAIQDGFETQAHERVVEFFEGFDLC